MRQRNIPSDIREDVKIGKIVPINGGIYSLLAFIISIIFSFLISNAICKVIFVLGSTIGVLTVYTFEIPKRIKRRITHINLKLKVNNIQDLSTLTELEGEEATIKTNNGKNAIFLEVKVPPWEICPEIQKERRADQFAKQILSSFSTDIDRVSIYGVCTAEDTAQLERRLAKLDELPEGARMLEDARIEHHYKISRGAKSVKYYVRIEGKEATEASTEFDESNSVLLGSDIVKQLANEHLTPTAKKVRGVESKMKIHKDHLILNNTYVKTFLVSNFPYTATPWLMYDITHGSHMRKKENLIVNFSLHFKKAADIKFDWKMNIKLDRLQQNIETYDTGKYSDSPREAEVKAVEAILALQQQGEGNYLDVWMTVTLSSPDEKEFKSAVRDFKNYLSHNSFELNELPFEQAQALDMAWLAGREKMFETYYGRVMDIDAVSALYPFVDGSITDHSGGYAGHRVFDATAVYKNHTNNPDNQNKIFVGSSDEGKSTGIKSDVVSLHTEGLKGYVYDVDGEYRKICKALNGTWVDYTINSGKYVDPTIIEHSIQSEADITSLDEDTLQLIKDADTARYQEAITNTRGVISLLSGDFNKGKENAMEAALLRMWETAGIVEDDPASWDTFDRSKCNIHIWYNILKEISSTPTDDDYEGARELRKDIKSYFEGAKKNMFKHAEDSSWLKNSKLTVFHVASSADNDFDQQMGAVKIVMIGHMVWQQIKRDRILKQHFSYEVYDEWQRLIRNAHARPAAYRSITTGRKFNDMVLMGFNDPSILFENEGGRGIWDNTKFKLLFSLSGKTIDTLSQYADMPQEVVEQWKRLPKYSYIFNEKRNYDVLRMSLPESEIRDLSKTRGLN